jgi:hypothetical protein
MLSRREFLTSSTVTLLLVPVLASACGSTTSSGGATPGVSCDGAGATSTTVNAHAHTLCVPLTDLESPPTAGMTYTTSTAAGHAHTVVFTQVQLISIAAGTAITVTTTIAGGHAHDFTVVKSAQPAVANPGGGGGSGY